MKLFNKLLMILVGSTITLGTILTDENLDKDATLLIGVFMIMSGLLSLTQSKA